MVHIQFRSTLLGLLPFARGDIKLEHRFLPLVLMSESRTAPAEPRHMERGHGEPDQNAGNGTRHGHEHLDDREALAPVWRILFLADIPSPLGLVGRDIGAMAMPRISI